MLIPVMARNALEMDIVPEKDLPDGQDQYLPISEAKERQLVAQMGRNELEDRYLRLREEHMELKKICRKQEEKMKLMATKLLRLVKDRKKMDGNEKGSKRDVETAELIEDLEGKVRELQKQNEALKSKLIVTKQQLQTHGKRQTPYDRVKPRINTGLSPAKLQASKQQRIREQMRVQGTPEPRGSPRTPQPVLAQPRYGHSLLEEARIEKRELEDLVASLQEQINLLEQDSEGLREQLRVKQLDHEEELNKYRSQMTDTKRANVQENIELIRLQRELKEKALRLQNLQDKYQSLEQVLTKMKKSHESVLGDMESLTSKLSEEQAKNSLLKAEMRQGNISQQIFAEKEGQIDDLKAEIVVLKEAHAKLLHSAFDAEKEREFRAKERQYQIKVAELEAVIKADLNEKNDILDKLTAERDLHEQALKGAKDLEVSFYSAKEELDDLKRKMKFFSKESKIDLDEIQEALLLIQSRKDKHRRLDFLEEVDEEISKDLRKENQKLQAAHADTINELDKTRSMLVMQHKINQDYQGEVDSLQRKLDELKHESDLRLQEYAQLLDIRAERIKKLEAQLRDVAYGTKQYKVQQTDDEEIDDLDATIQLERGQNVFEIHIGKANLSSECCMIFQNAEPQTFITYEFFEFELQATPVAKGDRPDFNYTSQYIVQVDDFFLHYIQKDQTKMELHRAIGTEYVTIATGVLKFDQILSRSHGRVHGTARLFELQTQKDFGSVEYWVRLRVPMEQALRLYKERTKALGYLSTNTVSSISEQQQQREGIRRDPDVNELRVVIVRCYNLKSRMKDAQPSPYVVYKFYDFADHDTAIVTNSNAPEYNDARTYPVPVTPELDSYLKRNYLEVYVFDDLDPDPASYIGLAKIPLISLSQDKAVSGTFEVKQKNGQVSGLIDVTLKWIYTYLPATDKVVRYPSAHKYAGEESTGMAPPKIRETFRPTESDTLAMVDVHASSIDEASTEARKPQDTKVTAVSTSDIEKETAVTKRVAAIPGNNKKVEDESTPNRSELKDEHAGFVNDNVRQSNHSVNKIETADKFSDQDTENESDQALLVEELRKTAEEPVFIPENIPQDTMFEEVASESDDDIVFPGSKPRGTLNIRDQDVTSEPESAVTSDSESVVVSPLGTKGSSSVKAPDSITIIVSSLTLFDNAPILEMDNVKQLFVAYKFLDIEAEELETPFSLPKPLPNRPIYFNFKKVFYFDQERNSARRQLLAHSLSEEGGEGRLPFTVVSEPGDGEDTECEDVAAAYGDFIQLLRDGKDLIDTDLDVLDLYGTGEVVGALTVTVEALEALRSLYA